MRIKITINGLVQGVGYRYFSNKTAQGLNITGFVRNLQNGDVEIEAQSSKETLDAFMEELWIGPTNSNVKSIISNEIPEINDETSFKVSF